MEDAIKNHFIANLPKKPYSTSNLEYGLQIRKQEEAIKRTYLQHNPPVAAVWLVFDCDKPNTYEERSATSYIPPPNLEVVNPANKHSHLFYGLDTPVYTSDVARQKPIRYLAAIENALSCLLDADPHYVGLVSKNPLHSHWNTIQRRADLWSLGELADWLDLPQKLPQKATAFGLGRNCAVFDTVRKWAYQEVLKYRLASNSQAFHKAVKDACMGVNQSFTVPLPEREITSIAKSIGSWVWKKYQGRLSEQDWAKYVQDTHTPAIQSARGVMSGLARNKKSALLRQEAIELAVGGFFTQEEIAEILGVNQATISRWLK